MSYFEEQMEAWEHSGCKGSPTDINPDEYWIDEIAKKENCTCKPYFKLFCKCND